MKNKGQRVKKRRNKNKKMEISSSIEETPRNSSSDSIDVIVEDFQKVRLLSPSRYFVELARICKSFQVFLPREIRAYIVYLIHQLSAPPGIYCYLSPTAGSETSVPDILLDIYFPRSEYGDREMLCTYWNTFDQLYTYKGDKRKDIMFLHRYRKNLSRIWNSDTETCFLLPDRNWIYVLSNSQFGLSDKDRMLTLISWLLLIYCIKPEENLYIVSHRMDVHLNGALFLLSMDLRGSGGNVGPPGVEAITWRKALLEISPQQ
jgi:hypothetical protein